MEDSDPDVKDYVAAFFGVMLLTVFGMWVIAVATEEPLRYEKPSQWPGMQVNPYQFKSNNQ